MIERLIRIGQFLGKHARVERDVALLPQPVPIWKRHGVGGDNAMAQAAQKRDISSGPAAQFEHSATGRLWQPAPPAGNTCRADRAPAQGGIGQSGHFLPLRPANRAAHAVEHACRYRRRAQMRHELADDRVHQHFPFGDHQATCRVCAASGSTTTGTSVLICPRSRRASRCATTKRAALTARA